MTEFKSFVKFLIHFHSATEFALKLIETDVHVSIVHGHAAYPEKAGELAGLLVAVASTVFS